MAGRAAPRPWRSRSGLGLGYFSVSGQAAPRGQAVTGTGCRAPFPTPSGSRGAPWGGRARRGAPGAAAAPAPERGAGDSQTASPGGPGSARRGSSAGDTRPRAAPPVPSGDRPGRGPPAAGTAQHGTGQDGMARGRLAREGGAGGGPGRALTGERSAGRASKSGQRAGGRSGGGGGAGGRTVPARNVPLFMWPRPPPTNVRREPPRVTARQRRPPIRAARGPPRTRPLARQRALLVSFRAVTSRGGTRPGHAPGRGRGLVCIEGGAAPAPSRASP